MKVNTPPKATKEDIPLGVILFFQRGDKKRNKREERKRNGNDTVFMSV